jgi:hypothetical protein
VIRESAHMYGWLQIVKLGCRWRRFTDQCRTSQLCFTIYFESDWIDHASTRCTNRSGWSMGPTHGDTPFLPNPDKRIDLR